MWHGTLLHSHIQQSYMHDHVHTDKKSNFNLKKRTSFCPAFHNFYNSHKLILCCYLPHGQTAFAKYFIVHSCRLCALIPSSTPDPVLRTDKIAYPHSSCALTAEKRQWSLIDFKWASFRMVMATKQGLRREELLTTHFVDVTWELNVMAHACNPRIWEAKAGGSGVVWNYAWEDVNKRLLPSDSKLITEQSIDSTQV